MSASYDTSMNRTGELKINKKDFDQETLDDSLRVDRLCQDILRCFYDALLEGGLSPEEATRMANGADYYIRDFVVDNRARNIFDERPGLVRQFAANWYIVSTIEPDVAQLGQYLDGILAFYRYLHDHKLVSARFLRQVEQECGDLAFYERRIEEFWAIKGDGYVAWEKACSLKED
ncbi:hypothetical protein [Geobacter sp. AOG1]|uniref:hypothetical protein n=1 Tax=Geobacter sp. AOG1 TaxID=1566346 RepID=UPI001CC826B7|nr:hypothetical protein [Geobacter sp. AOG1]GFE58850.1 hypothetical protein AOG1_27300 [Geobacter sp. AOG1]